MERHGVCDGVGVILLFVCLPNSLWITSVACCKYNNKEMLLSSGYRVGAVFSSSFLHCYLPVVVILWYIIESANLMIGWVYFSIECF